MSGNIVRVLFAVAAVVSGAVFISMAVLSWPPSPLSRGLLLGVLAGVFGASAFWLGVALQEQPSGGPPDEGLPGSRTPHAVSPEEAKRLLQTFLATRKDVGR